MSGDSAALAVENLNIHLRRRGESIPLVSELDLELSAGTITGLAGESGCGKSLTALALMGLLDPAEIQVSADRWLLNGIDLTNANEGIWQQQRGHQIAMVFQDPATALDPVLRIGQQMRRVLARQGNRNRDDTNTAMLQALKTVGFADAPGIARSYPHELSGGMRQLVVIAMAHAVNPAVLLADEPTTALDAGTQQIVLEQLGRLSAAGTAVLMITHELPILAKGVEQVMVMYHGRIVETVPGENFLTRARHPYSAGLIAATPQINRPQNLPPFEPIPGQVPSPGQARTGCAFAPRCPHSNARCEKSLPELRSYGQARLACHHPLEPNP